VKAGACYSQEVVSLDRK